MRRRYQPTLRFLLDFYDAWLREGVQDKVAAALGLTAPALKYRMDQSTDLQEAKHLADERRGNRSTLSGYVYQRLSPEAREVWDKVQFWESSDSAYTKIEKILGGQTKRLRQELFIHALVCSNFDTSSACRMVNVSRTMLNDWRADLEFRQLVEEIQWHKKNFFERALIDLVEQRHPGATIFVNKTVNADRGYGEKLQVEHSGQLETVQQQITLDDLELPVDVRKAILFALRKKQETIDVTPGGNGNGTTDLALPAPATTEPAVC